MAFTRGRYGVEYHRRTDRETHLLRWVLLGAALLAAVSFLVARSRRSVPPTPVQDDPPERPAVQPERPELRIPKAEKTAQGPEKRPADRRAEVPVVAPPRRLPAGSAAFAEKVDEWMASRTWQKNELELLTILRDSERHDNVQGARGAIEKLMYLPSVEDLKDQLVRRFGNLNTQLLFSGTNTPWTATIAVKRGDTLQRIATEHRTTLEALQKLNPLKDPNRLALGQKLRVLNFPDADLIVHKRLQFAELLFRKRIFKRYYVTVREEAEPGAYPVANETGARAADRLRALIGNIAAEDRDELRMFLAPGSRITVTAQ